MMFLLSLLIPNIILTNSDNRLQKKGVEDNVEAIKNCLLKIVTNTTVSRESLAVINDNIQEYLFLKLNKDLSSERWTFITSTAKVPELVNLPEDNVDMFLLQINDTEQLTSMVSRLKTSYYFNPRRKFLVTSASKFKNTTRTVSKIFEALWSFDIYNALVVLPCEENITTTNIYTWYPYKNGSCGKNFTNFEKIGQCSNGKLIGAKLLYSNKIPRKFGNCPVKVRTVVWPPFVKNPTKRISNGDGYIFKGGFEIVLMNTIAKALNLNVTYTLSEKALNWGEIYENGTATGLQAYILENEGDIGLSSQAYTETRIKFFDMGVPYFYEHLVWCVPHADTVPPWKKITDVFSLESWILNFVVYLVFTLSIWGFSKLSVFERKRFKRLFNCVESAFGILLGVTIFPVPRSNFVRLIFSLWFIFTLHVSIVFKTTLTSILTSPVYKHQISTVDEILQSNIRLQFLSPMKQYFLENQDHAKEILYKWIDCLDLSDCVDRVAYTRDSVILLPALYLKFIQNRYKRRSRGSYIYCFNGNILTYPGSMIMRKGFPLGIIFNEYTRRIITSGLLDLWLSKSLKTLTSNKTFFFENDDNFISLKALQPAFCCLLIGLVLGTSTFITEFCIFKFFTAYNQVYMN